MWKWFIWLCTLTIVIFAGYLVYDYYRAGLHIRPTMPDGAFSLSYKNGVRAIMVNTIDERKKRRYLATPFKVPFYLEKAWSFCYPPQTDENAKVETILKARNWPGERLDAVCKLNIDGKIVVRGIITSVPKR